MLSGASPSSTHGSGQPMSPIAKTAASTMPQLQKARLRMSGSANLAFLMNPVRMAQVRDIAFAGEVMPQKSTDFYPKLLTGLTIYALD